MEEYVAPAPAVSAAPAPVEEYVASAPAVSEVPAPVEYIAAAPAVYAAPAPSVESIAPAPVVYATQAPGVVSLAPAPVLSASPVRGEYLSPAPAVLRVEGPQGSVPGQSSTFRRGHDLPHPSGWLHAEDASGRVYYWHVHSPLVTGDEDEDEDEDEDDVPVVPLRELPAGVGVYVRSLGERAAPPPPPPPSSWSRAVTTFYGPLYLAVTCSILFLPEENWVMDFSATSLQECFRMLHSLVRQLILVWRQSTSFLEDFHALLVVFGR